MPPHHFAAAPAQALTIYLNGNVRGCRPYAMRRQILARCVISATSSEDLTSRHEVAEKRRNAFYFIFRLWTPGPFSGAMFSRRSVAWPPNRPTVIFVSISWSGFHRDAASVFIRGLASELPDAGRRGDAFAMPSARQAARAQASSMLSPVRPNSRKTSLRKRLRRPPLPRRRSRPPTSRSATSRR